MVETKTKFDFLSYKLESGSINCLPESVCRNEKPKSIHFIGLGGIGMSGLAKILSELDYKISGSDIKDNPTLLSMSEHGATVFIGHNENNINDAGLIVVSSAIDKNNPELQQAIKNGIPIIHRAQMLSLIVSGSIDGIKKDKVSVGITGTHGKTTTSGMVGVLMENAQLSPTIIVGGLMPQLNTNSKYGSGKHIIAELDESDGTIVLYKPDITVLTNLELDHADHYTGGIQQLYNTYQEYISNLPKDSILIVNVDSPGVNELIETVGIIPQKIYTYSCDPSSMLYNQATFKAVNIHQNGFGSSFSVVYNDNTLGSINIIVPGIHNISNALAVVATGILSELKFELIAASLNKFTGMKRRFQLIGKAHNITIVDDYAHHPTEIKATLNSAKNIIKSQGHGRVVAIFQPHRYSRLKSLWKDFLESFDDADILFITDIYAASEKSIDGISSENFVAELKNINSKYVSGSMDSVASKVVNELQPHDIVLTLGAGNITCLGGILFEKMERKQDVSCAK